MLSARVIPCLLLQGQGLVKTVKFKDPKYIGDPVNAMKIFNEKEVDELLLLDITATREKRAPHFGLIHKIVSEAFMPVAYGGGIRNIEHARQILGLGVEKIVISTYAVEDPFFIRETAKLFGSQSVLVCLDVKKNFFGEYKVHTQGGRKGTNLDPREFAKKMVDLGAGELILNSIDRDGTMMGYDLELVRSVATAVSVPVIACGGAGNVEDFKSAVKEAGASAVSAGSLFVFHGRHRAVLISYPNRKVLEEIFSSNIGTIQKHHV